MIYFIEAAGTDLVKVGYAIDAAKRLRDHQIGCPLKLQLIAAFDGGPALERRAHKALGKSSRGEWFPRKQAMQLARAWRRAGPVAVEAFVRWRSNEHAARAWHRNFVRKASVRVAAGIAREALALPPHQISRITGLTVRTWQSVIDLERLPAAHHIVNSLSWHGPRHVRNLLWSAQRLELIPQMQAIVDEDDARRAS